MIRPNFELQQQCHSNSLLIDTLTVCKSIAKVMEDEIVVYYVLLEYPLYVGGENHLVDLYFLK